MKEMLTAFPKSSLNLESPAASIFYIGRHSDQSIPECWHNLTHLSCENSCHMSLVEGAKIFGRKVCNCKPSV